MEFKPKDWVLVRDDAEEKWGLDIFSHKDGDNFICVSNWYLQCIPYEGNEALLGTTDASVVWKEGDKVEVLNVYDDKWHAGKIIGISKVKIDDDGYGYKVKSECFNGITGWKWCKADQLREPVEKQEEEEFKFGDKIEARVDDEWTDGLFVMKDAGNIPYLVYLPDENETAWLIRKDIRRAEG